MKINFNFNINKFNNTFNRIVKDEYLNNGFGNLPHQINQEISNPSSPESKEKYYCETCKYSTTRKSDFKKHNLTQKHIQNIQSKQHEETHNYSLSLYKTYKCNICGATYSHRSSLSRHKNLCALNALAKKKELLIQEQQNINKTELFQLKQLFQKNKHLFLKLLHDLKINSKLKKELDNNSNNSSQENEINELLNNEHSNKNELDLEININVHLNVFENELQNIQNFTDEEISSLHTTLASLNNNYSNAINLSDFIDNIQFNLEDLNYAKKYGFDKGVAYLFLKNLSLLEAEKIPLYCFNNEKQLYCVKDGNWEFDPFNFRLYKSINNCSINQVSYIEKLIHSNVQKMISNEDNNVLSNSVQIEMSKLLENIETLCPNEINNIQRNLIENGNYNPNNQFNSLIDLSHNLSNKKIIPSYIQSLKTINLFFQ